MVVNRSRAVWLVLTLHRHPSSRNFCTLD